MFKEKLISIASVMVFISVSLFCNGIDAAEQTNTESSENANPNNTVREGTERPPLGTIRARSDDSNNDSSSSSNGPVESHQMLDENRLIEGGSDSSALSNIATNCKSMLNEIQLKSFCGHEFKFVPQQEEISGFQCYEAFFSDTTKVVLISARGETADKLLEFSLQQLNDIRPIPKQGFKAWDYHGDFVGAMKNYYYMIQKGDQLIQLSLFYPYDKSKVNCQPEAIKSLGERIETGL